MAFRFNFTGRKRIKVEEAKIKVVKNATPLKIRLEQFFSSSPIYNADDEVLIDAVSSTRLERLSLGKIGELQRETSVEFKSFYDAKKVSFNIRVVDVKTKRLKGLAKKLKDSSRASTPADVESIFPVSLSHPEDNIGNRFWMLRLSDAEDPVLIISSKKFKGYEAVTSPEFKSLVLPEALRQILTYAFIQRWSNFPAWTEKWIKFIYEMSGNTNGPIESPTHLDDAYMEQTLLWIDDVIREFANYINLSDITIKNLTASEVEE